MIIPFSTGLAPTERSPSLAEQIYRRLRQAILTGMLITVLPMVGDYFTNQLLSGAPNTSMIGNLIQGQLGTPGLQGQGAVLSLLVLIVLLVPMVYYVVATRRSTEEAA